MSVVTSADGVVSVTVAVVQDADGAYDVQITNVTPDGIPLAIEIAGQQVWEDPGRTTPGGSE